MYHNLIYVRKYGAPNDETQKNERDGLVVWTIVKRLTIMKEPTAVDKPSFITYVCKWFFWMTVVVVSK